MSIWIPALHAGMTQPHFHALYSEHEALIDLRDFRVIRGSLPGRAMTLVLEWAAEHRDQLMEDWNLCSQLKPLRAIEPHTQGDSK